jgi:hypothetical protein
MYIYNEYLRNMYLREREREREREKRERGQENLETRKVRITLKNDLNKQESKHGAD